MESDELGTAIRCGHERGGCVCGLVYLKALDGILCQASIPNEECKFQDHGEMAFRKEFIPKVAERIEAAWNAVDGIPTADIPNLVEENNRLRKLLERELGELAPDNVPIICKKFIVLNHEVSELRRLFGLLDQWDCLNPPQTNLVADLGWVRKVVDAGLGRIDGRDL